MDILPVDVQELTLTNLQELIVSFPVPYSVMSHGQLDISQGGIIYTLEISKGYEPSLCFSFRDGLLNICQCVTSFVPRRSTERSGLF